MKNMFACLIVCTRSMHGLPLTLQIMCKLELQITVAAVTYTMYKSNRTKSIQGVRK